MLRSKRDKAECPGEIAVVTGGPIRVSLMRSRKVDQPGGWATETTGHPRTEQAPRGGTKLTVIRYANPESELGDEVDTLAGITETRSVFWPQAGKVGLEVAGGTAAGEGVPRVARITEASAAAATNATITVNRTTRPRRVDRLDDDNSC
jgi:hypothetical protein